MTLKNKEPFILPEKLVYLGIAEKLQFGTRKFWQTIDKSREQKRGACFYREKWGAGRGFFTDFSLARLLLDKQKSFLLPSAIWKVSCFQLGNDRYSYFTWQCMRLPPSRPPNSILNEVSFIFTVLSLGYGFTDVHFYCAS